MESDNELFRGQERGGARFVVELFGSDANGRKMIAWGRRIGCRDAGHGFEPGRGVYTRLLVDDGDVQQHNFLMELADNPAGLRAIDPAGLGDLTTWRLGAGKRSSRKVDP